MTGGDVRVLLVEDVDDNRYLARCLLESAGHVVEEALNGADALERAHDAQPDVILLDMSLPIVDGWEVLRRLQADPSLSSIPVVALTAHAMAGDKERILEAGARGYIPKPLSVPNFVQQVLACTVPPSP